MRRKMYDENPKAIEDRTRLLKAALMRSGVTAKDISERTGCHLVTVQGFIRRPQAATGDLINIITTMAKIPPEEQAKIFFPDAHAYYKDEGYYRGIHAAQR